MRGKVYRILHGFSSLLHLLFWWCCNCVQTLNYKIYVMIFTLLYCIKQVGHRIIEMKVIFYHFDSFQRDNSEIETTFPYV